MMSLVAAKKLFQPFSRVGLKIIFNSLHLGTSETKSLTDVLGGMKASLDSQRRTVENTIHAVKYAGVAPGARSLSFVKS